jgi:nitrile hydratase
MNEIHRHDHEHGSEISETQLRVRALETILTEKGYVEPAALDAIIEAFETRIGPHNGAKVVAKAWADADFKHRLLEDATAAVSSMGFVSRVGDHLIAVENTPRVHNMIVCTLCSCYPWEVLGLPPTWYKSAPYRSRAVIDPRGVLPISASRFRPRPTSGSGTRPRKRALSCCRCGRPALKTGVKTDSRRSSPATR